jgi:hypothetical protein
VLSTVRPLLLAGQLQNHVFVLINWENRWRPNLRFASGTAFERTLAMELIIACEPDLLGQDVRGFLCPFLGNFATDLMFTVILSDLSYIK